MSWGSEQNYEVTQIKTLLNPPNKNQKGFLVLFFPFFCAVWLVLEYLGLVTPQNLFPVTSI